MLSKCLQNDHFTSVSNKDRRLDGSPHLPMHHSVYGPVNEWVPKVRWILDNYRLSAFCPDVVKSFKSSRKQLDNIYFDKVWGSTEVPLSAKCDSTSQCTLVIFLHWSHKKVSTKIITFSTYSPRISKHGYLRVGPAPYWRYTSLLIGITWWQRSGLLNKSLKWSNAGS